MHSLAVHAFCAGHEFEKKSSAKNSDVFVGASHRNNIQFGVGQKRMDLFLFNRAVNNLKSQLSQISNLEPLLTPSPIAAMIIGSIGAVIMYFGTKMLENFGLDDVVGAIPVHMFAGIFGTLVVPFTNGDTSFATQFTGVISVCIFSFVLSLGVFKALSATTGLRISKEAEKLGTDKAEIGVVAYAIRD